MKIAVLGATGRTGIPFVRQALDQGHHVVAVVRNPSKLTVQHENLQIVTADIFSEESMVPHFTGSDAVVSCLASLTLSKSTFFLDSCKIILSAMRKAGVSRFMPMSSWCTTYNRNDPGPWFIEWIIKPLFIRNPLASLEEMEKYLMSEECLDINYTIIRPPQRCEASTKDRHVTGDLCYSQKILVEERQFTQGGYGKMGREDVAKFMLSALKTDEYHRKGIAIDVAK
ncbi:flavin reductase (NADPH)-like [Saccoglossus kowalevskii]